MLPERLSSDDYRKILDTIPIGGTMSTMEQQREEVLVRGTIAGIIQKGPDRWQVSVAQEGSQYTKNLWTKDAPLVGDMSQRIGQSFDFLCNTSHWARQDGQQVRSLWINAVGAYGTIADPQPVAVTPGYAAQPTQAAWPPPQPQMPSQSPPSWAAQAPGLPQSPGTAVPGAAPPAAPAQPMPQQRLPDEVKEMRIVREVGMKCACMVVQFLPEEQRNLTGLEFVSEWFVEYFLTGPRAQQQPPPQQRPPVQQQVPQNPQPPQDNNPAAYTDPGPEQGDPGSWPA